MSNNESSVRTSSQSEVRELLLARFYINLIVLALTLATLIYGVTLWCLIRKFRNIKNYVFLNAILANFLLYSMTTILIHISDSARGSQNLRLCVQIVSYFVIYFVTGQHHWVIVLCYIFYVDVVKVSDVHIRKWYLNSGLFGWCLPLIPTLIFIFVTTKSLIKYSSLAGIILFILPIILNCILYIKILCSVFGSPNVNEPRVTKKWTRLYIATLIFILCNIFLLYSFIINLTVKRKSAKVLSLLLFEICLLVLDILFIAVKDNRKIWCKRLFFSARAKDKGVHMHENVIREAVDNRPAILDF